MSDWLCLTPEHDENGRRLTRAERIAYARDLLLALDAERLAEFEAERRADPDLSEREVRMLVQASRLIMAGARGATLQQIIASLPDDTPAGSIH
jgi:hypothetical protein